MMKILIVGFVLLALGLASAVPQWPFRNRIGGFNPLGKEVSKETAEGQVFPALIPLLRMSPQVIPIALKLVRMGVCDNTDLQLQAFADNEEQDAQIMVLVKLMNDLLNAEEKLDNAKQLNMKGDLVAEAELFDTLKTKLKSAITKIGGTAKMLLCNSNRSCS